MKNSGQLEEKIIKQEKEIANLKRRLKKAQRLALHDDLTGLSNRRAITLSVEKALKHKERNGNDFSLLFIDLNDFGVTNKKLGDHAGDLLLKNFGSFLTDTLRDIDKIARGRAGRKGGDEFVVMLQGKGQTDAEKVRERILEAFQKQAEGLQIAGLSIGVSSTSTGIITAEDLFQIADADMRRQKAKSKAA